MIVDATLPAIVQDYLRAALVERAHLLLLEFAADWSLRAAHGDAAWYGIDPHGVGGCSPLRDLFVGLPTDRNQHIPFVELPNGRSAHVHLIADAARFHLMLVDAEDARSQQREQQQLAHEAVIAGQAKSKAIGQLKDIRNELERKRASLEEANALKNALISTLSHDFRTPLTSIFGYLRFLDPHVADADPRARQALHAIRRNAGHLFALAENLLEYGRGEAGALLAPAAIDLDALAADVQAMFAPLAEAKGIELRTSVQRADPAVPRFDEVKLRQLLANLVSNAVRYTRQGEVALVLEWRDGRLQVEVRDTGIGIAPEFQSGIFRPFNRGAQAGSQGAGLGLSIVRRVVDQMQGRVALESEPGRGTRVRVELPGSAAAEAPPTATVAGRRVVVVDDDPDIAQLLELLLIDLGLDVTVHARAEDAIGAALAEPPDLMLVDVELPDLSGNAAIFRLRAQGYRGAIISLSANATAAARDASLRAGADAYLTKPVDIERLLAQVGSLLDGDNPEGA